MKTYWVTIPISGLIGYVVDADDEESARKKARALVHLETQPQLRRDDVASDAEFKVTEL